MTAKEEFEKPKEVHYAVKRDNYGDHAVITCACGYVGCTCHGYSEHTAVKSAT